MPNNETIAQAMTTDGKASCPSDNLGATSTAEFQFTKSTVLLALPLPGSNKVKNLPVKIKAWGRVVGNTTTNFTAQIYSGSSTTIGSNTSLATSGAKAVNSVSGNWLLEIKGIWDGTSNKLQGNYDGYVNGSTVTKAILTDVTKPASAPSTEGLGLTVTGTFSASDSGNYAVLDGFEMQRD